MTIRPLSASPLADKKPRFWPSGCASAHFLVIANAVSLSRGIAAIALFGIAMAGASATALTLLAAAMWFTDAIDGPIARYGRKHGSSLRNDGAALDPLMDDLAFVFGFLVLLHSGTVPVWFVASLLASRVLFSVVRTTSAWRMREFPGPLPVTKLSGVVLAIGQILLFAGIEDATLTLVDGIPQSTIVAVMTAVAGWSIFEYLALTHWRSFLRLLRP